MFGHLTKTGHATNTAYKHSCEACVGLVRFAPQTVGCYFKALPILPSLHILEPTIYCEVFMNSQ